MFRAASRHIIRLIAIVPLTLLSTTTTITTTSAFSPSFIGPFSTTKRTTTKPSTSTSAAALTTMSMSLVVPGRPTWQQTMLRIKDPAKSLPFYQDLLGFTLIDKFDFPQYKFTLYFLTTLPEAEAEHYTLTPGTQEAHEYLWSSDYTFLELTHNHGTETDDTFTYHAGNQEKDGFGHIAVNVDDVYAISDKLEQAGCTFKKKPDEGRMKGLAFVYDPDGYWIEIVRRGDDSGITNTMNFSQTMLRVKDPQKSCAFYQALGMKLLRERHFDDFSLYFLGSSCIADGADMKTMFSPVLELTHNHGTETKDDFQHFNGNEEGRQGFGHIGFLVDDVYAASETIRTFGYGFRKEPDGGSMKGLAFAYDPDGYSVEIIKRHLGPESPCTAFGDDIVIIKPQVD